MNIADSMKPHCVQWLTGAICKMGLILRLRVECEEMTVLMVYGVEMFMYSVADMYVEVIMPTN